MPYLAMCKDPLKNS